MPNEISNLQALVKVLLKHSPYLLAFDAIHLNIPTVSTRSAEQYPPTIELQQLFSDCRVIINRLPDFGPLTRYVGPLAYERNAETSIVVLDTDSQGMDWQVRSWRSNKDQPAAQVNDLAELVKLSQRLDADSLWCFQGENFRINSGGQVQVAWDTFELQLDPQLEGISWNKAHFCRATSGVLFKPKFFRDFWFNQTAYHDSCLWDDDRWVSFQMERLNVSRKVLHSPPRLQDTTSWWSFLSRHDRRLLLQPTQPGLLRSKGTPNHAPAERLTLLNKRLKSDQTCTQAWLKSHPDSFPTARDAVKQ